MTMASIEESFLTHSQTLRQKLLDSFGSNTVIQYVQFLYFHLFPILGSRSGKYTNTTSDTR